MTPIRIPSVERPLVSVVMVLYGGWETARRAIADLVEHTEPCFELVLVENASPDDTAERARAEVAGARLIVNETNRGFGEGSNQGAGRARGRYLCFLNSDALVQPGWLDPLLETLEEPDVGAVVPLYLNADGSVQEAGSVIDSIGHAHAVGRDANPSEFEYRFRREIDFGSAACMLVDRQVFLDLGGFDRAYEPAYFEDADFCFKLKEHGLRTMYEPRSRVVHLHFGSGSFESARRLMEDNRHVFVERWGERLARRPRLIEVAQQPHQMLAARDAETLDRFMVIDDRVPYTDRGSGDPRMFRLLMDLAELWPSSRITFLAPEGKEAEKYAEPLLRRGIEVVCPPVDWEKWFERRRFHYSVVLVSRWTNVERYEGFLHTSQPQALRVFDTEALTFQRLERLAELLPPGARGTEVRAEAIKTRAAEIKAVQEADVVLCVSDEEAQFISEIAPGKPTFVLPGVAELVPEPPRFDKRKDLIFFGGFLAGSASPNQDAVVYLVNEVMPIFWERHPDVVLNVVGADTTPAVHELEGPRVNVIGYVDDPAEWLCRARLHVNPMRFGSGMKLKLLDSIGAGLPFVTTTIGAEGFPLGDLRASIVAEEPRELARLAAELYENRDAWERAQAGLLGLAATRFDRIRFKRTLVEAMSYVGVAPPRDAASALAYDAEGDAGSELPRIGRAVLRGREGR